MKIPLNVLEQMIALLLVMAIGYGVRLFGVLDKNTTKRLGVFLMSVTYPIMLLMSFQQTFSAKTFGLFCTVFGISALIHIIPTLLCVFLFRAGKLSESAVLRFCVIFPNGAFVGIPLLKLIFGDLGAFYGASFVAFSLLYTCTVGVFMLSSKKSVKNQLKALANPALIGAAVGFLLFLCHIRLPYFCSAALNTVGDMSVPLSMIILGSALREISLKDVLVNINTYVAAAIKLVAFPFVVLVICLIFGIPKWTAYVCILMAALPSTSTVVYMTEKYGSSRTRAVSSAALINALAVITVPLVMVIAELAVK